MTIAVVGVKLVSTVSFAGMMVKKHRETSVVIKAT